VPKRGVSENSQKRQPGFPRIHLLRLSEKSSSASQAPHHQATHSSIYERFAARTQPLVVPKLNLRLWQIQARRERSTTQRRGRTWNPRGGKRSFCQSTFLPSLAHYSAAHASSTFSGAGLRGRSTICTLHPKVFCTQPLPSCLRPYI
jgi:hypothetical protein